MALAPAPLGVLVRTGNRGGAGVAVGGRWVVGGMSTTWVETAARRVGLGAAPAVRPGPRVSSTTPKTSKPTPISARTKTPITASRLKFLGAAGGGGGGLVIGPICPYASLHSNHDCPRQSLPVAGCAPAGGIV